MVYQNCQCSALTVIPGETQQKWGGWEAIETVNYYLSFLSMDMKSRLSEWLDCAWFSCCCSDLEWLEKSIFPFESCAARHIIYGSLTLLSPYGNSVYVKVERFEVLSDERLEGRVCLAARCRCSSRLARLAAASPWQPAREGWGEQESSCRWGSAKTDWALAIWREKNFIPNFRGRIRDAIASNLRKFNSSSYRLFSRLYPNCAPAVLRNTKWV